LPVWRVGRGGRRAGAERLHPVRQRAAGDPEVGGDAPQRGTRGGLVQINGLPTEVVGVVLPGHGQNHLASPARCWIQRVQDQGSSPARWVHWYNTTRLHSSIQNLPRLSSNT